MYFESDKRIDGDNIKRGSLYKMQLNTIEYALIQLIKANNYFLSIKS